MMLSAIHKDDISPVNLDILNTCTTVLKESISGLRSLCFNLMPAALESSDLITAINELLDNTLVETRFTSNVNHILLDKEQTLAIYRVFQEFLNNSLKHAKATLISTDIKFKNKILEIDLNDNGKGFKIDTTKSKGRGLITMKNRIDSINGHSTLTSKKNKGTHLNITIECKKQ